MNPSNFLIFVASELFGAKSKSLNIYIYIYIKREREREQDLGTLFRCYSLAFSFKILPCDFFLMDGSVFFKLSSVGARFGKA